MRIGSGGQSPSDRAARAIAERTERVRRRGTTTSATTSVRLCVAPPTRKKRRHTAPITTMSSPTSSDARSAGDGSIHETGTVADRPVTGVAECSPHVELHGHRTARQRAFLRLGGERPTQYDEILT